jgi:hypothetical protein
VPKTAFQINHVSTASRTLLSAWTCLFWPLCLVHTVDAGAQGLVASALSVLGGKLAEALFFFATGRGVLCWHPCPTPCAPGGPRRSDRSAHPRRRARPCLSIMVFTCVNNYKLFVCHKVCSGWRKPNRMSHEFDI